MPAYVIAEIQITNPVRYEDYKKLTPGIITRFGGRFIARGGQIEMLEGDDKPGRWVIVEFPDAARARQWYGSVEYTEAKKIRQEASTGRMILVEGI